MKEFNTTAVCIPEKHYMVDISDKVCEIKKMVDAGKYFTINRARQYGKTTTLNRLKKILENDYTVLALDFQSIDNDVFENGSTFSQAFARLILDLHEFDSFSMDNEKQISEYFNYYGMTTGYMLSFNFNKKKEQGVKRVAIGDKVLFEGTV